MKAARFVLTALLALGAPALAHDFWIEPAAFHVHDGERVDLRLLIGAPGAVEHWAARWPRIAALQDFTPDGSVRDHLADIDPLMQPGEPAIDRIDARPVLAVEGTHMLAFASNQAFSELPPGEFADYADHEGLTALKGWTKPGRELYSRRAKALVQVGTRPSDSVSQPIGQTLEIVPEGNPLLLANGAPLRLRIYFRGRPLAGASVVLERLGPGATHGTPMISDAQGRVAFPIARKGGWKVNVVWSAPIDDPRADFETVFCSLTFGY